MNDHTRMVAAHVRPVTAIAPEDSIGRAAELLRISGMGVLPVLDGPFPAGVVEDAGLRLALAEGPGADGAVREIMQADFIVLRADAPVRDAVEALTLTERQAVVIVDAAGRYVGLVTAADLLSRERAQARPAPVGGMATPFGIFLTTGIVRAGRGGWALVVTGALLFAVYVVANTVTAGLAWAVQEGTGLRVLQWATALPPQGVPHLVGLSVHAFVLLLFLVFVRLLPLSAIHGAEHKVVHAIERGERMVPEVIKRMPRVHARCGTNLAVGAALFLGLARIPYTRELADVGLLLSLVGTVALWRPVGQAVQWFATTKEPKRSQLQQAAEVGEQLIALSRRAGNPQAGFLRRLAGSGLPQVLVGVLAAALLLDLIQQALGFSLPIVAY
jgi:CBS domain-containing protein